MGPFYSTAPRQANTRCISLAVAGVFTLCCATWAAEGNPIPNSRRTRPYYVETGFVWVNQKFLTSPYRILETDQGLEINGNLLAPLAERDLMAYMDWNEFEGDEYAEEANSSGRHGRRNRRHRDFDEDDAGREDDDANSHREFSLANCIADELMAGAIIVSIPNEPLGIFSRFNNQQDMLELVAAQGNGKPELYDRFATSLPPSWNRHVWRDWAQTLQVPPSIHARIEGLLEAGRNVERDAVAKRNAIKRLDNLAYPLTVFGMMLAVLSFGHLLMCLPRPYDDAPAVPSPGMMRATGYSLMLVVALSSMDLVWTLLASQAGQMKELNPLASRFIENPEMLIAFKMAATAFGCGVLYKLRHHSRAQFATWWLCLICTVLAFRWLTFNSMFIA